MTHRTAQSSLLSAMTLMISLSGCAHPQSIRETPAVVTVRAANSTESLQAHSPASSLLVWSRARDSKTEVDGTTTDLRTVEINERGEVVRETIGITVAVDRQTWTWATHQKKLRLEPCEPTQPNELDTLVESAEIVRVGPAGKGETRELFADYYTKARATNDGESALMMGAVTQSFEPVASIGPYLFVREHDWMFACGAHGFWHATPHVVDLRTGKEATLRFEDPETPAAKSSAVDAFLASFESDGDNAPMHGDMTSDSVEFAATEPRFSNAQMSFVNIYLTSVPYADGASQWSSYTVDTEVPTTTNDAQLAADALAPASVIAYAAMNPDRIIGGWSAR